VIGGLCLATLATLFFVPAVFALLRRKPSPMSEDDLLLSAAAETAPMLSKNL
jgi:hypothetical protein